MPADLLDILTFRAGYNTSVVLAGVALLGVACAVVGTFCVLRRRSMMADALAHATLPGVAGAFLAATALGAQGRSLPVLLAGAAITGALGVACAHALTRFTRLRDDAAIAAVLSVFFGLGIVLLSVVQTLPGASQGGLTHFILGQTAAMSVADARVIGVGALASCVVCALLFKELRLVAFDPEYARVQGWRTGLVDGALLGLLTGVTVVGLQAVGILMIVALLVIPPAAARLWTQRLAPMLAIAAGIGLLSGAVGAAISALRADAPAGAVIVLCAGACFVLSMLLSPRRGALARLARHGAQRWRAAREHALRAVLETGEAMNAAGMPASRAVATPAAEPFPWVRARDVARRRAWGPTVAAILLWRLSRAGLLERRAGEVRLTPAGAALAVRRARAHRLWERYLVACADRGEWNVDQNADLVEHVLSPDLVARLESALRDVGVDPAGVADLPRSVHPIGVGAEIAPRVGTLVGSAPTARGPGDHS